jgi:cytochrome b
LISWDQDLHSVLLHIRECKDIAKGDQLRSNPPPPSGLVMVVVMVVVVVVVVTHGRTSGRSWLPQNSR